MPKLAAIVTVGAAVLIPASTVACTGVLCGANSAQPNGTPNTLFESTKNHPSVFFQVASTLIYIVGAVAVIMLIIGGLRYVASQGNEKDITAAKDTILYAVIGIVVAIMAYAIVHFVAGAIKQ